MDYGPARRLRAVPWRWMLLNLACWTALAFVAAVQSTARARGTLPFNRVLAQALASFAPCALLAPAIALLALRFRFAGGGWRAALVAHGLGMVAFVVGGGAMMGAFEWMLPWSRTEVRLPDAAAAAVLGYLASDVLIYVLVVAAVQAAAYARESQERAVSEARLRAQLADARLHVLSAQLQPHFLFNTLHAISALVREEPRQAERLLARLSELLRHALQSGTRVETSLEEELAFLEKYVDVQEARFGARLEVTFQVDHRLLETRVPSLLLQPLVENAIRHGTSRRPGRGQVEISARRDGEHVLLTVRDNGIGLPADGEIREGIGLSTTRARLRQLYGEDHRFEITSGPSGGAVCTLVLPLRRVIHRST